MNAYTILFGTSANPPTGLGGHAGLVRWAATNEVFAALDGAPVESVWVLPVYIHAFRKKRDMPSFVHRFRMAQLAFESLVPSRIEVKDTERRLYMADPQRRLGTIDVVRHLAREYPNRRFALLLGADTYSDLQAGRWRESEALLELVRVIVVGREGVDHDVQRSDGPELTAVSSSAVRESNDPTFWADALAPQVMEYIHRHHLYAFGDQVAPR